MTVINVDFRRNGTNGLSGWNTVTGPTTTGERIADLVDSGGLTTGYSLTVDAVFGGDLNNTGVVGDHHGWNESTWDHAWYSNATPSITFGGLTPGESFALRVAGHSLSNRHADFTVLEADTTDIRYNASADDATPSAPDEFTGTVPVGGSIT